MKRPARDPDEPLLTRGFIGLIAWQGMLLAAVTLAAFWLGMNWYGSSDAGLRRAVTMTFMTLTLAQVFHAFSARSQTRSVFDSRLFTNGWLWATVLVCVLLQLAAIYWPVLQSVLQTTPLTAMEWAIVLSFALAPVAAVEFVKLVSRIMEARQSN